ncbi:MAG: hypothetical protein LBK73_14455 [Treponema sp.]|jgi:hypothetical protein|nr:hypothetical protein [Treponema sp.]
MTQGKCFEMADEFVGLNFNSIRLENRFVRAMETLERQLNRIFHKLPPCAFWERRYIKNL